MFFLIFFYESPKTSISFIILLGFISFALDILIQPYSIAWINRLRIISSFSWIVVTSSIMVSYSSFSAMVDQDFLIDNSIILRFQRAGNVTYYFLIIFFASNCLILLLKSFDLINDFKVLALQKKQDEVVLILKELNPNEQQKQIQLAVISQIDSSQDITSSSYPLG